MGDMIEVVRAEFDITCKRLISRLLREMLPHAHVFIIHHNPESLFEPTPLFKVLLYRVNNNKAEIRKNGEIIFS